MKIFVNGTGTWFDGKFISVDITPDDHLVNLTEEVARKGASWPDPGEDVWVTPTGGVRWIDDTPIEVWGPAL